MARADVSKQDRLQLRLDARSKHILQRAANHRRTSLSQFVLSTALEEAQKVVREESITTLSEPDWSLFYDALVNPPAPNAALRKAYRRYRKSDA